MPEYLAPGVYVEETSFRSKSIEGVGTSTAAFVGMTSRGPTGIAPPLLTSFSDFERLYGGVDALTIGGAAGPNYLALASLAFFNNGGGRLYVSRVLGAGAVAAASGALNGPPDPDPAERIELVARAPGGTSLPGRPGVNFSVRLIQTALASTKRLALNQPAGTLVQLGAADFYVMGGSGVAPIQTSAADNAAWDAAADTDAVSIFTVAIEVTGPDGVIAEHGGLGFHGRHPRFIGTMLGANPPLAADALANPVAIQLGANVDPFDLRSGLMAGAVDVGNGLMVRGPVNLAGGIDGTGAPSTPDYQAAFDRLLALEDISIVAAPGSSSFAANTPAAVNQILIGHAETRRAYRIAVLDTPPNLEPAGAQALKSLIDSTKAALYYPWIRIANPLAGTDATQMSEIDVPPSGAVCGIYARSDVQRGVFKAPANETVTGALGLQRNVRFGEQEVLNPLGINCIRALPNRGIRVWGARTLSSDPEWKYVNIRRYFLYLESSIDRGTQWAVFEPNGERLWDNVRTTVSDFLYNEWLNGALLGATPKEAYFVRCDRSTMSQNDLDNGRLICLVGVAALKPAEFVIFRIGQKTADGRD
jgi:uncharacterized protein